MILDWALRVYLLINHNACAISFKNPGRTGGPFRSPSHLLPNKGKGGKGAQQVLPPMLTRSRKIQVLSTKGRGERRKRGTQKKKALGQGIGDKTFGSDQCPRGGIHRGRLAGKGKQTSVKKSRRRGGWLVGRLRSTSSSEVCRMQKESKTDARVKGRGSSQRPKVAEGKMGVVCTVRAASKKRKGTFWERRGKSVAKNAWEGKSSSTR